MKFSLRIAALLLSILLLLSACAFRLPRIPKLPFFSDHSSSSGSSSSDVEDNAQPEPSDEFQRSDLSFEEMVYVRPDYDEIAAQYESFAQRVRKAGDAQTVIDVWLEETKLTSEYSDMNTLAMLRFNLNTADEKLTEEYQYMQDFLVRLQTPGNEFIKALVESPFYPQLAERFGARTMEALKISAEHYDPEQEQFEILENELVTQYLQWNSQEKTAAYHGEDYALTDLYYILMGGEEVDKPIAASMIDSYYREQNQTYGELYRSLVQLRTETAKLLGYDNYLDYHYAISKQQGYGQQEVENFRSWVREYLVPVRNELREQAMERNGTDQLTFLESYSLLPENEKIYYDPSIQSTDDVIDATMRLMRELSVPTGELVDYLEQYHLLDLKAANNKSDGAFTTFFYGYQEPFVFSSYEDAGTYIHELGHALNYFRSKPTEVAEQNLRGADIMEIHSQSLELLASPKLSILYGDTAPYMVRSNIADMLQDIINACVIDEFQHEIYANPDMSLEEYNAVYARLNKEYMGEVDYLASLPLMRGWTGSI
ncbi:MAG: M3 family metallopeptidase [Oscillospiraceae bacterium]|nr:M3 family metallopeptidase [Oscillospiraceae bacterium]